MFVTMSICGGTMVRMTEEREGHRMRPELPKNLRVRFCPSPTGTPHVGMVRTALFNWAQARHSHGTLVFRIEDTDAERDTELSYRQIMEALRWLGLDWDEGVEIGGPDGPYRQSQRSDIYRDVTARLLNAGYAYESYSTAEEIQARNVAAGRPKFFGYDGYDRTLTDRQRQAFRDQGRRPAIRIRMPDENIVFDDLIRGRIEFKAGSVPDYVIVRPNGDPLYTLTNPVDDALMRINLVLRGEDLLSSTPRQIALYHYLMKLGMAHGVPLFGHLPYVMGPGLGWSFGPDRDVFSIDEFIRHFDVRDVKANPAHFDIRKAVAINAEHIRMLDPQDFLRRSVPYLHRDNVVSADTWDALTERERRILTVAAPLVQPRVRLLGEVSGMVGSLLSTDGYIVPEADARKQLKDSAGDVLTRSVVALEAVPDESWRADALHRTLTTALVDKGGYKPRQAFGPIRVAVSGRRVSPPLFQSLEILGRNVTLSRLHGLQNHL